MSALATLAAAHGLKYNPNKPHKLAVPLSKALSTSDMQVHISNPTETSLDITVYVRRKWGYSGWGTSPANVPAIIEEARENIARVERLIQDDD